MKKILILGASSDIGFTLLKTLSNKDLLIGAHCYQNYEKLDKYIKKNKLGKKIKIFKANLVSQNSCHDLVKKFLVWSKSIDVLIQLNGNISKITNWKDMKQSDFEKDINYNLSSVFYVCQKVFKKMENNGGKIILMSTSSALHGGGEQSLAYGMGKLGVHGLTKGLARFGAKKNMIVNAVAPGYINTKFHTEKMKRKKSDLIKRAQLSKLNRAGETSEVAGLINFLLSENSNYITGEVISIDGGDWI